MAEVAKKCELQEHELKTIKAEVTHQFLKKENNTELKEYELKTVDPCR